MREEHTITRMGAGVLLAILVLLGVTSVWWSGDSGSQSSRNTMQRIRHRGSVRIGYANEAPYGYLQTATGEITGEAPEIARVILKRLGVERIEPVVTEFGALIPGLKAGRFDLIAAGMYITPARCKEISFSDPTYKIGEAFIVRRGNPLDLHSFENVAANPRARLGVVGGAVEDGYAQTVGVPDDRIVRFPDNVSAVTGVASGRVDAFAATVLTVRDLLRKAGTEVLEQARPFYDPVIDGDTVQGFGAFGFRKHDQEFLHNFNEHLNQFIGSKEHLQLVERFGIDASALPGDITAETICQF